MTNLNKLLEKVEREFDDKFLFHSKVIGDPAVEFVNTNNIIQDTTELKSFLRSSILSIVEEIRKEVVLEKIKPPSKKCINAESTMFGKCFDCERNAGYDRAIEKMEDKFNNLIK
jgi:hypothetical protein